MVKSFKVVLKMIFVWLFTDTNVKTIPLPPFTKSTSKTFFSRSFGKSTMPRLEIEQVLMLSPKK